MIEPKFIVGDKVCKTKGYAFDGVVVSTFMTLGGDWRVVVEMPTSSGHGLLHIFNQEQLEKVVKNSSWQANQGK